MPAAVYFKIRGYEVGGTKSGFMQYKNGSGWDNLGGWEATENGTVFIDSVRNPIPIDYDIFEAGGYYQFRLVDSEGTPISNVVGFTFPYPDGQILNITGEGLENVDDAPLLNQGL